MHYDPTSYEAAAASDPSALVSDPDAHCVAGCYRCLLSYFNQPDHVLIDRRQESALHFLLRLAFADTHNFQDETGIHSDLNGCPLPDAEAIVIDGYRIDMIWRAARIAAVEQDNAPPGLSDKLAAKGIELVVLPSERDGRQRAMASLAIVLGGNSK
jgi:hypothetical protein